MMGGDPRAPYSTKLFEGVYARYENTQYPGEHHDAVVHPLPRVSKGLPDLDEILKLQQPPAPGDGTDQG